MFRDLGLVLITDRKSCKQPLIEALKLAIRGGVNTVQLRERDMLTNELFELALEVRRVTIDLNAILLINDRVDIMLAVDADGLHAGKHSMPIQTARKIVGKDKLIGFSAHNLDEVRYAQGQGADYISLSPIFPTTSNSKRNHAKPLGPDVISKVKGISNLPVIALGGINEYNIDAVLGNSPDGIAVMSAILQASDPLAIARKLREKMLSYSN